MKSSILAVAGLSLLTLLGSCSTMKNNNKQPDTSTSTSVSTGTATKPQATTPVLPAFAGDWSIIELDGKAVKVNGENHPKLSFQADESQPDALTVIGFNGCNYLNGTWVVKDGKISTTGEFITSLKACHDAPYEQAVNAALSNVASYTAVSPLEINLLSATGRVVMKLRKQGIDFINGAWRVTNIEDRNIKAGIKIVIDTAEGRVHGNAGCNIINCNVIVNYDKGFGIEFKDVATTRMTCPDIAEEQAFILALEQVATAAPGKNADTAYLCNASGQKIMTLKRLSPDELVDD